MNLRNIVTTILIIFISVNLFSFTNRESTKSITLKGNILVVGNSPNQIIILKTEDDVKYTIIGNKNDELYLLQNREVEVTGRLTDGNILNVSQIITLEDPIYLTPAR